MNEVRDCWVELQVEEPGVITGNKQRIDVSCGKKQPQQLPAELILLPVFVFGNQAENLTM